MFQLFRNRFETSKQTEIFVFGFTKKTETDLASVCFGSNEKFFVCFEDTQLTTGRKANVTIAWFEGEGGKGREGEPKQV